jgi:hypothetical protein
MDSFFVFHKISGNRILHVLNPGRVVLTLPSLICKRLESLLIRKVNDQVFKNAGFRILQYGFKNLCTGMEVSNT